jgi:hypothetical protein
LAEIAFRPNPSLWVLEIAIVHPERQFGAFYEDLLLEDQSFRAWALSAEAAPDAARSDLEPAPVLGAMGPPEAAAELPTDW